MIEKNVIYRKKYFKEGGIYEVIDMYNEYLALTSEIIENYDGELSEDELNQIEFMNNRYKNILNFVFISYN